MPPEALRGLAKRMGVPAYLVDVLWDDEHQHPELYSLWQIWPETGLKQVALTEAAFEAWLKAVLEDHRCDNQVGG